MTSARGNFPTYYPILKPNPFNYEVIKNDEFCTPNHHPVWGLQLAGNTNERLAHDLILDLRHWLKRYKAAGNKVEDRRLILDTKMLAPRKLSSTIKALEDEYRKLLHEGFLQSCGSTKYEIITKIENDLLIFDTQPLPDWWHDFGDALEPAIP